MLMSDDAIGLVCVCCAFSIKLEKSNIICFIMIESKICHLRTNKFRPKKKRRTNKLKKYILAKKKLKKY